MLWRSALWCRVRSASRTIVNAALAAIDAEFTKLQAGDGIPRYRLSGVCVRCLSRTLGLKPL